MKSVNSSYNHASYDMQDRNFHHNPSLLQFQNEHFGWANDQDESESLDDFGSMLNENYDADDTDESPKQAAPEKSYSPSPKHTRVRRDANANADGHRHRHHHPNKLCHYYTSDPNPDEGKWVIQPVDSLGYRPIWREKNYNNGGLCHMNEEYVFIVQQSGLYQMFGQVRYSQVIEPE